VIQRPLGLCAGVDRPVKDKCILMPTAATREGHEDVLQMMCRLLRHETVRGL